MTGTVMIIAAGFRLWCKAVSPAAPLALISVMTVYKLLDAGYARFVSDSGPGRQ